MEDLDFLISKLFTKLKTVWYGVKTDIQTKKIESSEMVKYDQMIFDNSKNIQWRTLFSTNVLRKLDVYMEKKKNEVGPFSNTIYKK